MDWWRRASKCGMCSQKAMWASAALICPVCQWVAQLSAALALAGQWLGLVYALITTGRCATWV